LVKYGGTVECRVIASTGIAKGERCESGATLRRRRSGCQLARLTSGHNSVVQEVQQSLGNHGGQTMELNPAEGDLFAAYLSSFTPLAGDRRTASLLGETVRGIIASESLCCARIAAFSPWVGGDAAR
jgi:hypothetical protein